MLPAGSSSIDVSKRAATPWSAAPPAYANDPKYKKYTQQVEKCLNSFDNVHEWADFISFLKQLLKTFQAYMQFKEIPRKVIVAKRLSQCLNPALPTGVHQRALDVYAHICVVLGTEGLQRDLALWSSGLFPFFEYAATSVKPTLLNIFDTHFLPLQGGLRPAMKSFILALLPGLEEETGEFFDKVMSLLDRLSGTVSPSFFLQNVWLVMLTSPSSRGTALNFLSRRLPSLKPDEDISSIVGRDIGLMIRAISAALEDDDSLVRRSALDVLVQSLPLNSVAIQKAPGDDRTILMRAATSVVLRRDLALNRRLFTWLLGPEENSQQQTAYYRAHSLSLLTSTLRDEMFHPSSEYSPSRPFKIFISLLDKWEIGSPLTEVLVLDCFKALRKGIEYAGDATEELAMTASTLYEAVEPLALWKQLLGTVFSDIFVEEDQSEGVRMVRHVLSTYHTHDEEIEALHLPICFASILEATVSHIRSNHDRLNYRSTREAISLLHELLKHTRIAYFKEYPRLSGAATTEHSNAYNSACGLYSIEAQTLPSPSEPSSIPVTSVLNNLTVLTELFGAAFSNYTQSDNATREPYIQGLLLLSNITGQLHSDFGQQLTIKWEPNDWLGVALKCIENKSTAFAVVDNVITTVTKLHEATLLEPKLSIDKRSTTSALAQPLLRFLRPAYASYHMRAVSLIWSLENASSCPQVVSIISQSLTAEQPHDVREACEAFGVLWRLTDDSIVPGFRLKVPMMIVLDTLRNDDPGLRRVGETWMRCSLKSYLRILDPFLYDLCDPAVRRSPTTVEFNGRQVAAFTYDRPFDQRYTVHVLGILMSVVKFGGQGFSKIARSTPTSRSFHAAVRERCREVTGGSPDATYMDAIVHVLLRFLQSEPKAKAIATMGPYNESLQSSAVDILQALVSRGEVETAALEAMEVAIVGKLFVSVHSGRLDIQNKLLHLLHSIISSLSGHIEGSSKQSQTTRPLNPLLTQTLIDGISLPSNRAIMQHWLDFVLMTIPQFHDMLLPAVLPLNACVCNQLKAALRSVRQAATSESTLDDLVVFVSDADFVMLLNAIERLVLLSLSQTIDSSQAAEEESLADKSASEGGGLLGYVSNVFSADQGPAAIEEQSPMKSSESHCLYEAVQVLYAIWDQMVIPPQPRWGSQEESLTLIFTRTRTRCRRVLEHLFRAHPLEVIEAVVECWYCGQTPDDSASFELIDVLTSSAQNVIHMLCEAVSARIPGVSDRPRRHSLSPSLSDVMLFEFWEQYLRRLEGPVATQVWGRCLQFFKDIIGTFREFKLPVFYSLRCFTVLADKLTQTTAIEDKRVRKEVQDTFSKLVELCLLAGRSYDQGGWIRRGQVTLAANGTGRESPVPRVRSELKINEKLNASATSLPDAVKPTATSSSDLVAQVNGYLASDVVPNARKFLVEADKTLALCSSIVTTAVAPSLKSRSKPLDVDDTVLAVLRELTKIPSAIKAWRGPIVDVLNDNRCFNSTPQAGRRWRVLIKMLFETDKAALTELLSRITTAPSANIFTNREYEMLLRSLNLRRLSYVILTGDKNQYLTQLPTIQEKLVDTLRNVTAPIVQSEVYLCVRILLCRLSPHNLSSFWPVILTELYRVFEQVIVSLPSDGSEELGLVLAATKLLDLLLVLETEEFQVHQWIFITDTVDAVYRPNEWFPTALLDRLAEVVGQLPSEGETGLHRDQHGGLSPVDQARPMRRPLLQSIHQIDSIRDLIPFFSRTSLSSYESVYTSGGTVDWEAVEDGLFQDMFDGR